ncbi:hypothetical protein V2K16_26635 [Pseudomonas alliivorans]|uniref:hypothetical protein n=1 Tax=Pseudomonas alliivorans TaxID=2810613 RepID=UPI001AE5D79C|nr:hypothetical protein [Pseudomonas alliivorans]MBP0943681.1 hypothetical protein [Pseudomonas alliivorans]MEE4881891.1 hypothetical protein [Pseudomonas alliivorans]MEE4933257.1 hypothetical protein [Pseudomonas alliivorans]MEE4938549.1 hypothetical protein [Pseudomonas alliivorans]MEE4943752.1 hypothetical protein [Pseudomonas alliivorans]
MPVLGLEDGAQPEQSGRVMQLYGRRMQPNNKIPANQSRHLYLATPLRGVWNEAALLASLEIILCESLIDAMTFWCAGFRNVISAYGVNGFSQDHWHPARLQRQNTASQTMAEPFPDDPVEALLTALDAEAYEESDQA